MGVQVSDLVILGLEEQMSMFGSSPECRKEVLIIHDAIDGGKVNLFRFLETNSDEDDHQQFWLFSGYLVQEDTVVSKDFNVDVREV